MPINRFKKPFIGLLILLVFSSQFSPLLNLASTKAQTIVRGDDLVEDNGDSDYADDWEPTNEESATYKSIIPETLADINSAVNVDPYTETTNSTEQADSVDPLASAFESVFKNNGPKIIFSPADAEEIRMLGCLNQAIPDYANDSGAILAERPNLVDLKTIETMKTNNPDAFTALVDELKQQKAADMPTELLLPQNRQQLACILNYNTIAEVETELQKDRNYVTEQINVALDTLKIDTRILKMLNYLVTPKNQGGAGHDLIKVYRLRRGFTIPGRQQDDESDVIAEQKQQAESTTSSSSSSSDLSVGETLTEESSQESTAQQAATASGQVVDDDGDTVDDFAIALNDSENQVISAHAEGEAIDIEALDTIKCTLIKKRRLGGDKKTAQPAKPIELLYQTEEGYNESPEGQRDTVNSLVSSLYKDGLIDLLGEFNVDINNIDDLSDANLGDILEVVGQSLIGQLLNTNGSVSGNDLQETLKMVGAVYLADKLDLPRVAIYGAGYQNLDDIKANIGRATLEESIGLPFGSLSGETPNQIFYSIGERKMERQLNLPTGTLTSDIKSERQLLIKVGASLLEDRLNLNRGSFLNPKLEDIRKAVGERKFDLIFSMPEVVDTRMNLESLDGADGQQSPSRRFRKGEITPAEYLYEIAAKHLTDYAYIWAQFQNCTESLFGYACSDGSASRRDEVFNTPDGTTDQVLTGQIGALVDIGRWELASKLTSRDDERHVLLEWFRATNASPACKISTDTGIRSSACPPALTWLVDDATHPGTKKMVTVDLSYINKKYGLSEDDFYLMFGASTGGGGAIFANIGANRLYQAILDSPDFVKAKNEFLASHPEISSLIQQIEFYSDRVNDIKTHLNNLDKEMEAIKNDPDMQALYQAWVNIRDKIRNHSGSSVENYKALAKEAKIQFGFIRATSFNSKKLTNRIQYVLNEVDQIFYDIQEIITGKDNGRLTDFKFSQFGLSDSSGNSGSGGNSRSGVSIRQALWMILTGQATVKEAIIYLGGGYIEEQLNLPANTFYYYIKSLEYANSDQIEQSNVWGEGNSWISYFPGEPDETFSWTDEIPVGGDKQNNKKYERERFFASLGQAAIEEQMYLPANAFQGKNSPDPANEENINSVISNLVSRSLTASNSSAKKLLEDSFGTSASLDRLLSGDTAAWSQAKNDFNQFDKSLNLASGTTQSFLTNVSVQLSPEAYLSQEETDLLTARLGVSESALLKLTHVLAGDDTWQSNPFDLEDFNPYKLSGSAIDASGNCVASTDGQFVYNDQDGSHTFASREQAINYFNAHRDRQLDYIGQLATSLAAIPGIGSDASHLNAALTNYLKNSNNTRALSEQQIAVIAEAGGVSSEILERLFVREDKKSNLFKYLVAVGESVGEQRLKYALLGSFGVSLGSFKLSAADLFDMLNGSAPTTLYRMAGTFLDNQLGVETGTFAKIISAPNDKVRLCLLEQAGFSWVFKKLGISGMQLFGNPYQAIGGGKIETALNWPRGTFTSDSPKTGEDSRTGLIELIDKVGLSSFVKGFKIPLAGLDFRATAQYLFPNDPNVDLSKMDNYKILDRLDSLLSSADLTSTEGQRILAARDNFISIVKVRLSYLQDPNSIVWKEVPAGTSLPVSQYTLPDFHYYDDNPIWGTLYQAVNFGKEITQFQRQLKYLDITLQIPSGKTQELIQGKITPDAYRDLVSNIQIGYLAVTKLAELLGMEETQVSALNNTFRLLNLKMSEGGDAWSHFTAQERLTLFKSFQTIFSLNLDQMAKFRDGTFEKIVMHPENAVNILVKEGLYRLDRSMFGKNPDLHSFSTEAIYAAYTGNDNGQGFSFRTCAISSGSLSLSGSGLEGGVHAHCYPVQRIGVEGAITEAGQQMANYIRQLSCKNSKGDILSTCLMGRDGETLLTDFIRTGNVKFLEALANAELAARINLLLDRTVSLPAGFQVTWGDIAGALLGNSTMEDQAASYAEYYGLLELADPAFAAANQEKQNWYDRDDGYGITGQINIGDPANPYTGAVLLQSSQSQDIDQMVLRNIQSAYTVPAGSQTLEELRATYLTPPQLADFGLEGDFGSAEYTEARAAYFAAWDAYNARLDAVKAVQDKARDRVRQMYQKNLQYHFIDSMLYQQDNNIPPGFAAAMFEGNNKTRANALLAWFRNSVISGKLFGLEVSPLLGDVLIYAADTLQWGSDAAFANFVTSGKIKEVDNIIRQKFKEVIGIDLAPDTFTALFAGWKNGGDFSKGITVTSGSSTFNLPALKEVYVNYFATKITGWLDKVLGFDTGSTYKIYKATQDLIKSISAYHLSEVQLASSQADLATHTMNYTNNLAEYGEHDPRTIGEAAQIDTAKEGVQTGTAKMDSSRSNMTGYEAALVTLVITTIFSDQLAAIDQALGLTPGSSAMLVGIGVQLLFSLPVPWLTVAIFVLSNLFGYYKIELKCTADGYYPEMEQAPSSNVKDNGGLGVFNGLNANTKKTNFVKAAQYKARVLLGDVLSMPKKFADQEMTPSQIMTGRKEDVDYWLPLTSEVIYKYTGMPDENGNIPSRAGLWYNPQTTGYTHIGF